MREIKFRVWDKNVHDYQGENIVGKIIPWDYVVDSDYLKDSLNGDYPLMQYTGLKDKNGKEIYEGDVCKYYKHKPIGDEAFCDDSTKWEKIELIGEIEYNKKMTLAFSVGGTRWFKDIEVIGNIYENPELIKK